MKEILTLGLIFMMSVSASALFARMGHDPEKKALKMTERMVSYLRLTAAQEDEIYLVNLHLAEVMADNKTLSPDERRAAMKKLRSEAESEYQDILTAEQWTDYEEFKEKRKLYKAEQKFKSSAERAKIFTEKQGDYLALSDEQYDELVTINTNFFERMKEIRTGHLDKDAIRNEMMGLRKEQKAAYKKILTKSQMQQIKVHRKELKNSKQRKRN